MTQIQSLSGISELALSDLLPAYSLDGGITGKVTLSTLLRFLQENMTYPSDYTTQYAAPSSNGFTVNIDDGSGNVWLILTPTGGFASGTVVLPPSTLVDDKQEVLVNCTQSITALTVNGNGSTVTGAPTTISANGYFRLRFDGVLNTWYRVG